MGLFPALMDRVLICRGGSPWPPLRYFWYVGGAKRGVATESHPYKLVKQS